MHQPPLAALALSWDQHPHRKDSSHRRCPPWEVDGPWQCLSQEMQPHRCPGHHVQVGAPWGVHQAVLVTQPSIQRAPGRLGAFLNLCQSGQGEMKVLSLFSLPALSFVPSLPSHLCQSHSAEAPFRASQWCLGLQGPRDLPAAN